MAAGYLLPSLPPSRLLSHLYDYFVVSRALSPFHPPLRSRPRSRYRSHPHPCPRARSRSRCRCRCRSRPRPHPCSRHHCLPPVSRARSPLGDTWSNRRRVLHPKMLDTCRCNLLSTAMMPRAKWQCLVSYSSFLICSIPELSSPPFSFPCPFPLRSHSRPRCCPCFFPTPVSVPVLRLISRLRPRSRSHPVTVFIAVRSFLPVLWTWLPPWYISRE